jgi:hypothetical protein
VKDRALIHRGFLRYRNGVQVTLELPDEIASSMGSSAELSREVLQSFAVEKYRMGQISRRQLSDLLKLDYWQTDELLTQLGGGRPYTLADLEIDRRSLAKLG